MNFNEINDVYLHMKKSVYPNVKTVWDTSTETILIDRYLSVIDDNRTYKLLCVPYLMDSESFLKKYKEQCIIFYNTLNQADGLMLFIHQVSPTVHIHSRFFCWYENGRVRDYISSLVFYKNYEDAVKFIDENFVISRSGNTEENENAGFGFAK